MRELDELEGLVEPRPRDEDDDAEAHHARAKRARIEPAEPSPAAAGSEGQPPSPPSAQAAAAAAPPPPPKANGILSADAVGSLQFMASLRAQQKGPAVVVASTPAKTPAAGGLGGLAAYGSDDDSD